jgi:very-short-patch-repair endonuclease
MSHSQNPGCSGFLLGLFGFRSKGPPQLYPYGLRDAFLSPAELSFYHVLHGVASPTLRVVTKVNLADLFFVRQPHQNRTALNRIDRKHVDFILCDPKTMQPLLGIELDDASHQRRDRQKRDAFVDQVFAAAGLPIRHLRAARGYDPQRLAAMIHGALKA